MPALSGHLEDRSDMRLFGSGVASHARRLLINFLQYEIQEQRTSNVCLQDPGFVQNWGIEMLFQKDSAGAASDYEERYLKEVEFILHGTCAD